MKTLLVNSFLILMFISTISIGNQPSTQTTDIEQFSQEFNWRERLGAEPLPVLQSDQAIQPENHIPENLGANPAFRLAYQSYRDGNWEIYFAQGDGEYPTRLTSHPASDARPALNQGSLQVAFNSSRDGNAEIYTVKTDGSGLKRLTNHAAADYAAEWSPDGHSIAFVSNRDGNEEIYLMNADGSNLRRFTYTGENSYSPVWSPDGSRLAWIEQKYTDSGCLWTGNADGTEAKEHVCRRYMGRVAWTKTDGFFLMDGDTDGDLEIELLTYTEGDHYPEILVDYELPLVDAWAGSVSTDDQWAYYSRVEYIIQNDEVYIKNTYLEKVELPGGGPGYRLINSGVDLNPFTQNNDPYPPKSQILELPAYSSSNNLNLEWVVVDQGPSDLVSCEVQVRSSLSYPDEFYTPLGWDAFSGTTHINMQNLNTGTFFYRVRALDSAGNLEAWPYPIDPGDTHTKVYGHSLEGVITDGRGNPIFGVEPLFSLKPYFPPITNMSGFYQRFDAYFGGYAMEEFTRSGYGLIPYTRDVSVHHSLDLAFPPQDNLVQNNGFEHTLDPWITSGNTGTGFSPHFHTGENSARLDAKDAHPASLSQPITLTIGMEKPTLTFFYKSEYFIPNSSSGLKVSINDTPLLELKQPAENWTLAWADLSPWNDQKVTLAFILTSETGSGFNMAWIDDVSVGSWKTSLLTQISPNEILEGWDGQVLVISGENFLFPVSLSLDDTPLEAITQVDETTLTAILPGGLRQGWYDLVIVNGAGITTTYQRAVHLGNELFIPNVRK